jgi:CheY-like chemotaxis protein
MPPLSVLLVDDEEDILESLQDLLLASFDDVEVRVARSGAEALEAIETGAPDLIFSDYKMPGMNGIELLQEAARRVPEAARVLVTAFPDATLGARAAQEANGALHLSKPFELAQVLGVVEKALEARRGSAQPE